MSDQLEVKIIGKDELSATLKGIQANMEGLADIAKGGLTIGLGVATAAFGAMTAAIGLSIKEAMDAEMVDAELSQAITRMGDAAFITQAQAQDLANSLRDLAGGSDDAVKKAQTVLLRFKSIGEKTFPDATKTALDLAAALKIDTASAAQLLGKSLSTPGEGLNRLKAAGVDFTKQQEDMIKQMTATGDVAGAQKVIMAALAETVGGSAAAKAKTFGGQLEIMRNHLLDVAEGVGAKLLPVLETMMTRLAPIAEKLAVSLAAAFDNPQVQAAIWGIAGALTTLLADIGEGDFSAFEQAFSNLIPPEVQAQLPALLASLQNLFSAVQQNAPMVQGALELMGAKLKEAFATVGPQLIENLTTTLNIMAEFWRAHGTEIMAAVTIAWQFVLATIGGALTIISTLVTSTLQFVSGDFDGAWATILAGLEGFWNLALSIVGMNLDQYRAMWAANWEMARVIVVTVWQMIQDRVTQMLVELILSIKTKIQGVLDWMRGTVETWKQIGSDMANGMLVGIQMKVSQIIETVQNMVKDAVGAARTALGIASPSKEFAKLGAYSAEGFMQGISRTMPALDVGMTRTFTPTLASGVVSSGTVGGGINIVVNYSSTVSLADELEAKTKLAPFIASALREAGIS